MSAIDHKIVFLSYFKHICFKTKIDYKRKPSAQPWADNEKYA